MSKCVSEKWPVKLISISAGSAVIRHSHKGEAQSSDLEYIEYLSEFVFPPNITRAIMCRMDKMCGMFCTRER